MQIDLYKIIMEKKPFLQAAASFSLTAQSSTEGPDFSFVYLSDAKRTLIFTVTSLRHSFMDSRRANDQSTSTAEVERLCCLWRPVCKHYTLLVILKYTLEEVDFAIVAEHACLPLFILYTVLTNIR